MSKKIGVGIIGSGAIAQQVHIPGYQKLPNVEVLAVADINPAAAETAATQFKIPHQFTDYEDLLKMPEIQAVSVCTPNYAHKDATIAAAKAGKHILCEKPIALNAREGREMVQVCRANGVKLQIGYCQRFSGNATALKRFIDQGALGEVYYARAQALRRRGIPGWGVFTQKDKQGGGPLIDIGVHILDLTIHLMGHPKPVSVSGMSTARFGTREGVLGLMGQWDPKVFTVEDFAVGLVKFANGAALVLESSFCANIEKDVMNTQLLGTEGGATLSPPTLFREEAGALTVSQITTVQQVQSHHAEIAAFIEAIVNDTEPLVTGEQGLTVARIIDAIYESQETGREVRLA
ncbi:MAG: Gfo/Idh/MocA family oxidoreductase [Armatimonadetes bacterium]|nr:Gfo/Idh/MocA family oxidoreductase [Armatimonadota bacterium]